MNNIIKRFLNPIQDFTKLLGISILFIIAIIIFVIWAYRGCSIEVDKGGRIDITPTQIAKIKSIGQWEFLAISDEELIDTIRRGFFGDDELARIYYGTLRLGIDLNDMDKQWIKMNNDTVIVMLPPIKLLDENFIDEGLTKAFFEEGKWSEKDKAQLTKRAATTMKARCLTRDNITITGKNATAQISNLLHSMGYEFTKVRIKEEDIPK